MIIHPYFIFGHLEKTGGTFIEDFLIRAVDDTKCADLKSVDSLGFEIDDSRHKIYSNPNCKVNVCRHDAIYRFIPTNKEVIKFGFIRNPYDWYLSLWCFSNREHITYKYMFAEDGSYDDINIYIKSIFSMVYSLCYYNNCLIYNKKYKLPHISLPIMSKLDIGLLTYRYLYVYYHPDVFNDIENYAKYLLVDNILKFEKLIENFVNFVSANLYKFSSKQIEVLYNAPKIRATRHKHYSENYYSKEVIDLIRHKDRIIFKEHKYEF